MPRYTQPTELTPFAQVLVDYMWNRRSPTRAPMAVPQLASKLGVPRQNVSNWIYRGTVPNFEVVLAVLAGLNIPLRALYDAYQRAGLTVPRWDEQDTASTNAPASSGNPAIPRNRKPTAVPISPDDAADYYLLVPDLPEPAPNSTDKQPGRQRAHTARST